jgi:hypothetical protein
MNLFDVKNALETIVRLNPRLSKEKLVVLLDGAGWNKTNIEEAIMLFTSMTPELPDPVLGADHLLDDPQRISEEAKQVAYKKPEVVATPKKDTKRFEIPHISALPIFSFGRKKSKPKVSEVTEPVYLEAKDTIPSLPEDLPLKPFDSSPHTWTLSTYKDLFHGSEVMTETPQQNVLDITPSLEMKPDTSLREKIPSQPVYSAPKQRAMRDPLSGDDMSLTVVVSLLFLVILLLLGYMYGNHRLIIG